MWVTGANAMAECIITKIKYRKLGMAVYTFNFRTQKVDKEVNFCEF